MFNIEKTVLKNSITQYTYWDDISDSPFGILWVRFSLDQNGGTIALLLNCLVVHYYRRKRVATNLIQNVLSEANTLLSASGSRDGGFELLEKNGFKHSEESNLWYLNRKGG